MEENQISFNDYDSLGNAKDYADEFSFNGEDSSWFMNSFLGQLLFPGYQQEKEFGQHVALQDWMNKYNDPSNQMARMKAAGINPNLAAQGIAGGNSSPSVSGPASSAVGSGAASVGSAAQLISGAAGAVSSFADAAFKKKTVQPTIDELKARAKHELSAAGLDNANTEAVLTDNTYRVDNWKAELNVKRQNYRNMVAQYNVISKQHDQIIADINLKIATAKAQNNMADYYQALELQTKEETRWMTAQNDFRINNNLFITESGIDGYIFGLVQAGADMSQFDTFVDVYSRYRGSVESAVASADYAADPFNEEYRKAYNHYNELLSERDSLDALYDELEAKHSSGDLSDDGYNQTLTRFKEYDKQLDKDIEEAEKAFTSKNYAQGHRKQWQDLLNGILPFGLGMTISKGFIPKSPKRVKGYGR